MTKSNYSATALHSDRLIRFLLFSAIFLMAGCATQVPLSPITATHPASEAATTAPATQLSATLEEKPVAKVEQGVIDHSQHQMQR